MAFPQCLTDALKGTINHSGSEPNEVLYANACPFLKLRKATSGRVIGKNA